MGSITVGEIVEETGEPLRKGESLGEYVERIGRRAEVPPDVRERVVQAMNRSLFATGDTLPADERAAVEQFRAHIKATEVGSADHEEQSGLDQDINTATTHRERHRDRRQDIRSGVGTRDGDWPSQTGGQTADSVASESVTTYKVRQWSLLDSLVGLAPDLERRTIRIVFLTLILATLIPIGVAGLNYDAPTQSASPSAEIQTDSNITMFSVQGGETGFGAGVYALNTDTKEVVWKHTGYFRKYFDVDPLNDEEILFTVQMNTSGESFRAVRMNWRTGETITTFPVPRDTHDIDFVGNGTYVIADKYESRIYEYRPATDEIVWEYRFANHFPPTAGDGIENDYTHLNDVDRVKNGTAYLVSPREFDRVLLINRSTKEVVWTLGEQGNETILDHQHNPALLSTNPPTVLVADSENNRVVEYKRTDGEWERTWLYDNWPWTGWVRDADRLPNGNTLIVASGRGRLLEVTPSGEMVWKMDVSKWAQGPYDMERLRYGDEATGPPMDRLRQETLVLSSGEEPSLLDTYYSLARWLFPTWVTKRLFLGLHLTALLLTAWASLEVKWTRARLSTE